ncbi:MAG: HlyD family efflux transporter periplasmic adaptor subunit [Rhizobiales bacterium]|nr:HlyD family efflux transporter periplasmic adaptor subunit [Hyphomicrobiales bacterium]
MQLKQRIFPILGGVFGILGLIYAVLWFTEYRYIQTTDNAYVSSDISVISPKVTGYLASVDIAENAYVHKGDVLAQIDPRDFEIALNQAKAKAAAQHAAITTYGEQVAAQIANAEKSKAEIAYAEAEAVRARADLARYTKLASANFASKQKLDQARADTQSANASLASARAAYVAAEAQVSVLRAQQAEAEKLAAQVDSEVEEAQRNLDYTVIRAPIDGVVGNKNLDTGQLVQPGQQLASLVALPHVYVEANFKETQIENMRVGQEATITTDAYPDVRIKGHIASFSPASGQVFSLLPAENATGNFTKVVQRIPLRIAIPDDNELKGLLRPGLSVTVSVNTRSRGDEQPAEHGGVYGAARDDSTTVTAGAFR